MLLLPFSSSMWELVYSTESKVISQILLVINMNQAHQTGNCWTVVFCFSLGPLRVLCVRAPEVEATNFLPFHDNGQNLTTVSFILASSTLQITADINSLKICILKPCLSLFYPLLDPMKISWMWAKLLSLTGSEVCWAVQPGIQWAILLRRKNYGPFLSGNCCLTRVYYYHLLK